jgi:secondary thiamine-phosphate synthase enzyme
VISSNKSTVEHFIDTAAREALVEVTAIVQDALSASGVKDGVCVVYTPHTTCAVTVNENADPDVRKDILRSLDDIVRDVGFDHQEGNSQAHVKSSLLGCSQTFVVENGRLCLGKWQGIYLAEFDGPRRRKLMVKVV